MVSSVVASVFHLSSKLRIDNGDLEHMCNWLCDSPDILAIYQSIWT